jgi:Protein of unknown function (DUF3500)
MTVKTKLIPARYDNRSALWPSPLSELHESVRTILEDRLARGTAALAHEFKGVTTDGTVVPGLFPVFQTGLSLQPVAEAAAAFQGSLTPDQRQAVRFPIDGKEWRTWNNASPFLFRHGLCLHNLTAVQRDAALALMRASLSAGGFEAHRNVMKLNEHARELTNRPKEHGEWYYFFSMFGEPSAVEPWGWQIDGAHLIINCFTLGDQMVLTPDFLGSEPVAAESGKYAGVSVLRDEESRGYALMDALAGSQRDKATISKALPRELFTTSPFDNQVLKYAGIGHDELSPGQKGLLRELIWTYIGRIRPGHAELRQAEIDRHLSETYFAWIGPCDEVSPFYYRVHSPVILIEFDHQRGVAFANEEPTRNHAHSLVRTPNGNDYGRDLLRQHYLQHDHSHPGTPHLLGQA